MDHLIVTCKCGQRMRVTDDRIGRTGHCVKCGRKMRITKNRVAPLSTMPTTESPSDAAAQQARGRQSPAPNMMMLAAVGLILILIIACALVLRSGQRRQAEQPQKGVSAPVTRSIPEPRQSPRTASTTTETAIRCDKFDVIAHLDGDTVRFRLETDLPDYTEVMVGVSRSYYEADGTEYAPAYMNKKSTVGEWHTLQPVSVADHVFEDLLQERVDLMAKFGESFKVARVENEIEVSFVVPINQSNPVFGEKNVNLHGTKVSRTGLRTVEGEKKLRKPLARRPSASYTSAKAHYASLEIGGRYKLSEKTPLMPELEPADPLGAITRVRTLSPLSSIVVRQKSMKRTTPWYYVQAFGPDGQSVGEGWINSGALLGQNIEILK